MQVHSIYISFYILKWIMLANMINIIMIQGMAIASLSGWVKNVLKSWKGNFQSLETMFVSTLELPTHILH